jgi:choline transport protein
MLIGMTTVIIWTIAFMFAATDLDEIIASPTPYMTVYRQALRNDKAAIFFTVWLWLAYMSATTSCYATSGRLVWAFSRDNGLPFSDFFRKVHPTLRMPVNATILTAVFAILYGLIYIGSTTAFNSFLSISILFLNITYTVPQAIVAIRGREKVLPPRPFALGKSTGLFCNVFSSLWIAMYAVWFCFPSFLPVTAQSMNYLSVIAVGSMLFIGLSWWLGKRKTFIGPNVVFEGEAQAAPSLTTSHEEPVAPSKLHEGH